MKFRHILSIASSLLVFAGLKSQAQNKTVTKKETVPQVKSNTNLPDKTNVDGKLSKHKGEMPGKDSDSKLSKHKGEMPGKDSDSKLSKHKGEMPGKDSDSKLSKHKGEMPSKSSRSFINAKPGDVLFTTDFASETIGDMPANWKTKSLGEIKTVEGREGKWLKLEESSKYESPFKDTLPQNFKIEFDFIAGYKDGQGVPELNVRVFKKGSEYREGGVTFLLGPSGGTSAEPGKIQIFTHEEGPGEIYRSEARHITTFSDKNDKREPVHVILSIKGNNVKAWINGEKVYDLQEVVMPAVKFDHLDFEVGSYGGAKRDYDYYVSNIKIIAE